MKICQVGAEMCYEDEWRDKHGEGNSCFLQFCECA